MEPEKKVLQLEKPLAFARNRSKGHLTLQGGVWALGTGKKSSVQIPDSWKSHWHLPLDAAGKGWDGQAAVLEPKKRALCRSPTAGKAIGICKTTGGKVINRRCREGFEGAIGICTLPFQRPFDGGGEGLGVGTGKKSSVQIPDNCKSHWHLIWKKLEKPLAFDLEDCKTTGKATGRCREGFEGARRQSWKRKKELCADPRQLEKPLALASNRSKGH